MHPGGLSSPGDPNAAFHLDGAYHLHYILNHEWRGKRSFSFVRVTSPDLLHWTWQPTSCSRRVIRFASKQQLIDIKSSSQREKDRIDIAALRQLIENPEAFD